MNIDLWMAAITYASSLILLAFGFTLSYQSDKTPNFTIGPIMAIGSYTSFTFARILNIPVYLSLPVSFVIGFLISIGVYVVMRSLRRRGRNIVLITISSIAAGIILTALTQIYAAWVVDVIHLWSQSVLLKEFDFKIGSIPGVFLVSTGISIITYITWRHIYSDTHFGSEYRAIRENPELAMVQGINPERIWLIIWGVSGSLACLAGSFICLWYKSTPLMGPWIMTPIFAASLLGGLDDHRGFFIGGLIVGLADIMLTTWGQEKLGTWFGDYRLFIAMTIMILVLYFKPQGLFGKIRSS